MIHQIVTHHPVISPLRRGATWATDERIDRRIPTTENGPSVGPVTNRRRQELKETPGAVECCGTSVRDLMQGISDKIRGV